MKNHRTFKLQPVDGLKTLNNHHVNMYEVDGVTYSDLISHETRVAVYNHDTKEMSVNGYYSRTTARHINSFLDYYGFDTCTKSQIEKYNQK